MAHSPTKRALAELKRLGFVAAITERWNFHAKVRQDMFGFADLIYLTPANIVALQVTSGDHHAHRRVKILAEPLALAWIRAGGLIEVWSFSKKGKRGERKTWQCRKEEIVEEDFG